MTKQNAFIIRDLYCGYRSKKVVLTIPELDIPKGKLVFVIGVSGGGKSTLLETLGMMNRTVQDCQRVDFLADSLVSLPSLWDATTGELDDFRRQHYSFIFQKTNLMPNFSCGENMMLPALFKNQSYEKVKIKVLNYMDLLGLNKNLFDEKISNISGGQKQRIAFIRAMVADFTVLFGDEPTGNLDPGTAKDVMKQLKKYLKVHHKTGIVVSHDIDLAATFADMIIPIEMDGEEDNKKGIVKKRSLLFKNEKEIWYDEKRAYENVQNHLKQLIA